MSLTKTPPMLTQKRINDLFNKFASLYFLKMKPALKEGAIKKLRQHFAPQGNRKGAGTSEA